MEQQKVVLDPIRASQDSITNQTRERLLKVLTPEQKAIYEQMLQAQRERAGRGSTDRR